ncbi:hypothetical protein NPIL_172771 [Nephila pilipes]|uniref:Uncharacterized protein n=1 Tax=Nephila pilipes TaxID=299642 RepID=A0A8X6NR31_NEPPI|nr:hypothetical protein NPIL_172771 [Nephila pilipes]
MVSKFFCCYSDEACSFGTSFASSQHGLGMAKVRAKRRQRYGVLNGLPVYATAGAGRPASVGYRYKGSHVSAVPALRYGAHGASLLLCLLLLRMHFCPRRTTRQKTLVSSMRNRLKAVIEAKGMHTKY